MPENLPEALKEGVQVPLMVGFNSLEGLLILKCKSEMLMKLSHLKRKYVFLCVIYFF